MPIRTEQRRRVPSSKPASRPRHAAGARSPEALQRPAYEGGATLDPTKRSIWDSDWWALPLAAIGVLVLWLALVVGGNVPVSAYDSGANRPAADTSVGSSTVEVAR